MLTSLCLRERLPELKLIGWAGLPAHFTFAMSPKSPKRILLIDRPDLRRDTREWLLRDAGYEVVTAEIFDVVKAMLRKTTFDLVVVSVGDSAAGAEALTHSQRLRAAHAALPMLVLSDNGFYLPKESLITGLQSGSPQELIAEVGKLLESTHIPNNKKPNLSGAEND